MIDLAFVEWFWSKVATSADDNACWEWQHTRAKGGYGVFVFRGRQYRAHRIALMLTRGSIADGLWALHGCDNPPCCNPAHLYPGDNLANVADRVQRGRGACGTKVYPRRRLRGAEHPMYQHPELAVRGSQHPNAKLSESGVAELRALYHAGERTLGEIAAQFSISPKSIRAIVRGRTWRHAPGASSSARRIVRRRGSAHHQAKLSEADVAAIRERGARGVARKEIAAEFRISKTSVGQILKGETWRHVA